MQNNQQYPQNYQGQQNFVNAQQVYPNMQPQMQMQQQPMMQYQQPNNMGGIAMAQPGMPGLQQTPIQTQQQMILNNLLQIDGKQRLQQTNSVIIIPQQASACSDIAWSKMAPTHWDIKSDNETLTSIFNVKSDSIGCCQSDINGSMNVFNYDKQSNATQEKIFDVKHTRKCCFFKCIFGWCSCLGALNWCILSSICPSKSTISDGSQTLGQYKYSACGRVVRIMDQNNNIKYMLKPVASGVVSILDSSGQTIPNAQIIESYDINYKKRLGKVGKGRRYKKSKIKTQIQVTFAPNMSIEEKAIIIYGACKMT